MSLPISGFTAVPNPMMLSFLATQGFAIMYYGGAGWQFGKRKVSGMSNEQVNNMTPNELLQKLHSETKTMVPTMQQGMEDMTPLIHTTITQFGSYIREAIKAFPEAIGNIFNQSYQGPDNPYGNITNVRLSQGSQQFQRDRELYAGGATSQFQKDVERQKERDRQQASLEAEAKRRQDEIDRQKKISATQQVPPNLQVLHQRFGRTSTQTLQIGIRDRITLVQKLATDLVRLPKTIRMFKGYDSTGRQGARISRIPIYGQVVNPRIASVKKQLQKAQQDLIDFQAYIQWRKK